MLKDEDPKVRAASAGSLGEIGAEASAAIAPLAECLKDDDAECRTNVADALGEIAAALKETVDTSAIPALQKALEALEEGNFPPKALAHVSGPLESLKAEAAAGRGRPPDQVEIDQCRNLVVQISGELDGAPILASGVIFGFGNDRLYIATARHVVWHGESKITGLRISLKALPGEPLDATLAETGRSDLDLAVLIVRDVRKNQIPVGEIPFRRLGKPQGLGTKEKVYALGLPMAQPVGPVPAGEFLETSVSRLYFRSPNVRTGYSGGALFNSNWQLVGMIRAAEPDSAHAIPIDQLLSQLKDWGYPVSLGQPSK
jgi:S1-C subfamily serine protease